MVRSIGAPNIAALIPPNFRNLKTNEPTIRAKAATNKIENVSIVAASQVRPPNDVRDFPVPMRHRGVRIELQNRSFRKGKSHECSFHARSRLGKECVLGAWGRCGWGGDRA